MKKGLKVLLATVSAVFIAAGAAVGFTPVDEEYKNANFFKKIENKITNTVENVVTGVQTATDYTKATTYVIKHQDEVRGTFTQYQNGEISAQQMVDEIASEIDVEYVYDFVNKYATNEQKQQIKDFAEQLKKSGVNIDQYLPEEAREELFK